MTSLSCIVFGSAIAIYIDDARRVVGFGICIIGNGCKTLRRTSLVHSNRDIMIDRALAVELGVQSVSGALASHSR
ncbi:hypothetical protein D3C87_1919660 [compost metagenome]